MKLDSAPTSAMPPFSIAGYRVEPSLLRVSDATTEVRLESKVMQVLLHLAEHAGQTVSRSQLERAIWPGRIVTEDAVTNAVLKLRRAFADDARRPRIIETIPKTGYRLVASVEPLDPVRRSGALTSLLRVPDARRRWRHAGWAIAGTLVLITSIAVLTIPEADVDRPGRAGTGSGRPAVAVLPFANLSANREQDYFANGITADLITDLSKASGLLLVAPGTVFAYTDSDAGPGQISAELSVDYVVVGSVQRSGQRLRVNVQLIDAVDEHALWAERYEGSLNEIFDIQDGLTAAVLAALQVELAPLEQAFMARRPTDSVAAYDHYLQGLEAHGHRSPDQNKIAREQFRKATELDPTFARAFAGLALTHSRDAIDGWVPNPSQSLDLAAELAITAAGMDPTLPQVHFVRGQVELFRRRHLAAITATEQALRVDPNYADAYALAAWILNYSGRTGEAETAMDRALRLNPRPTASYLEVLGEIRFVQHRYTESASVFARVLHINPAYVRARMWEAAALAHAGAMDEAEWAVAELMIDDPGLSLRKLEFAFPFKDPRVIDAVLDGLSRAGIPAS